MQQDCGLELANLYSCAKSIAAMLLFFVFDTLYSVVLLPANRLFQQEAGSSWEMNRIIVVLFISLFRQ